jgi:hypothetical protein
MTVTLRLCAALLAGLLLVDPRDAGASGHGPVFGAATPTLGRGGWSVDQAYSVRFGEEARRERMLKTMVTFGVTEVLQVSASVPLAMSSHTLAQTRMMSAMSNGREFEGLLGYRFQRRPVGIGGRRESTLYIGGTVPFESTHHGAADGGSISVGAATGYASRAHYAWFGGALYHFLSRQGDQLGQSLAITFVYGYRPPALRTEAGKPDLRFFVESTFEHRQSDRIRGFDVENPSRTLFVGPTSLLVYKAIALEGGVQFPVYQRVRNFKETARVAVNFSYFFWLK